MILWTIIRQLHHLSRSSDPDAAFTAALKQRLAERGYLPARASHVIWFSWQRAVVSFSLLFGLFAGTASYAYYAPEVVPTHPLYGVKSTVETLQVTLTPTADGKERVRLSQLKKHIKQTTVLAEKNKPEAAIQASVVLSNLNKEILHASSAPVASVQEEIMRDEVEVDRDGLADIADQQRAVPADAVEERKIVREMLIDQTKQLNGHISNLINHKRKGATREDVNELEPVDPQQDERPSADEIQPLNPSIMRTLVP